MYAGTEAQANLPMDARPMVTAGFRCAPLKAPTAYTATATPNPQPAVMTIHPAFWPLVLLSTTLATTPSPRMISSMVPSTSARKGGIGLGEEAAKVSAEQRLVHRAKGPRYDHSRNHRRGTHRKPDCTPRGGKRLRCGDRQFTRAGDVVRAHRGARSTSARGHRRGGGEGWRHGRRIGAVEELSERSGCTVGGQNRHRYEQLLPWAGRSHPRARQRVDHHVRTVAGASANLEGGQGVQPYLCRRAHDRRTAGWHEAASRTGDRR